MSDYTFDKLVQFDPKELDQIFKTAFGYKTDETFVEVGAYDGRTYSHTCGLADLGWRGIYVEPVPALAEKCRSAHAKNMAVTVLEYACGDKNGMGEIFIDENSCCGSSINPIVCKNPKIEVVEMRTLDNILTQEEVEPGFDLLSIDVEFGECSVLKGFDAKFWLPKMIMIELCETHGGEKQEWAAPARSMVKVKFEPIGYKSVYSDKINAIFVR